MSRFRYPVDTDQFQGIRERGLLYVDKTDMMYNLASKYRYVFLARPRRTEVLILHIKKMNKMNKKKYQSPRIEAIRVQQNACICNGSTFESQIDVSNNDIDLGQDDVWTSDLDW